MHIKTFPPYSRSKEDYESYFDEADRRVRECGIFHEGELKGSKLPRGFRTYPIAGFESLISNLTNNLITWESEKDRANELITGVLLHRTFGEIRTKLDYISHIAACAKVPTGGTLEKIKWE